MLVAAFGQEVEAVAVTRAPGRPGATATLFYAGGLVATMLLLEKSGFQITAVTDGGPVAAKIASDPNPFPSVCGRICTHVCETECTRGQVEEPIAVAGLERDKFVVCEKPLTGYFGDGSTDSPADCATIWRRAGNSSAATPSTSRRASRSVCRPYRSAWPIMLGIPSMPSPSAEAGMGRSNNR